MQKIDKKLTIGHVIENNITGEKTEHKGEFKGLTIIAERSHNKNITKI